MNAPAVALAEAPYRIHRYPSALIDRVTLADGRRVTVRPVLPQDAEAERDFVAGLAPETRRLRFHGAVKLLPEWLLQAMTAIDYRRQVALVAEAAYDVDDDEPRMVADARYVLGDSGPHSAEFALVVADDWQGAGLGREMLHRLARHARRHGIVRLEGSVLAGNVPMLALLESLGATLRPDRRDHSTVHAAVTL